jgi:hypothetical protein
MSSGATDTVIDRHATPPMIRSSLPWCATPARR